ncbi:lysophospholipid acyltransferase family protein [Bacteroidales bacterium OttesenSCG-928-M11]|nr:lysophospholipid acyltransferase family protein [Bacteroidales bacterium OttesenSCG-928-M11]
MKDKLISVEEIQQVHKIFNGFGGRTLAKCVMGIAGLNNANKVYDSAKYETGPAVEDTMLDYIGIKRVVKNIEVLHQFKDQPFITVSNHPYGHIDGIALIGEIAKIRSDYKVMVNWILGMIDIMDDHFIGVNPFGNNSKKSSLAGVKECIDHLKDCHPLGFFPSGAISNDAGKGKIKDREWQEGVIKLIKKAKVPVVPVYISGKNSKFFYLLEKIDWRIRTVRLCHELKTKKGKTMDLIFGEPISPEEQEKYTNPKEFGQFLQDKTYELSSLV